MFDIFWHVYNYRESLTSHQNQPPEFHFHLLRRFHAIPLQKPRTGEAPKKSPSTPSVGVIPFCLGILECYKHCLEWGMNFMPNHCGPLDLAAIIMAELTKNTKTFTDFTFSFQFMPWKSIRCGFYNWEVHLLTVDVQCYDKVNSFGMLPTTRLWKVKVQVHILIQMCSAHPGGHPFLVSMLRRGTPSSWGTSTLMIPRHPVIS